jgi:hypothetical protein
VPLAMVAGLVLQARATPGPTDADVVRRLPSALRWLLAGLAALLLASGVALLLAPEWAAEAWAWPLTPLTARAVGAWLVGLGWAAAHAGLVDDAASVRPVGLTGAAFVVLEVVALLRHGDALDWSGWQAAAYVAGLAWIALVSGWILSLRGGGAAGRGSSR